MHKRACHNRNVDIVSINVYTKFGQILSIRSKILSGYEILACVKGRYSVTNLQNVTRNDSNLDHVNVNVYTKFGQTISILSQDIERKQNSDINQGP